MNGIPAPVGRRICLPTGARTYCAGQRVTRVEDEVVTHLYYTGSALLFTTVNEYVLQTQNILDPSGTIVASKRFEGQAATGQDPYADDYFFYRYDIRGSVTNIVDGEGAVVKSYDYDELGVTTSTGDTFFNEVTFTGSVADASGLLYMNARYYNPATARFLSQDTYTGSASVPWTQHLYVYCNNNPVNMIDPTGHSALLIALLVAITVVTLTGCNNSEEIAATPEGTSVVVKINETPCPEPPPPMPTPTSNPEVVQMMQEAEKLVGTKYNDMDCAQFVRKLMLPHDSTYRNSARYQWQHVQSSEEWNYYNATEKDMIPAGAVVFYAAPQCTCGYPGEIHHVAISCGNGWMYDSTKTDTIDGVSMRSIHSSLTYTDVNTGITGPLEIVGYAILRKWDK